MPERQQLKWLAYAAVMLVVVTIASSWLPDTLSIVMSTSMTLLFPVATGIAVVRYRLYDIDRLINRTLVYGLLTALLGAVYAGTVLVLGQVFGGVGGNPPSWAVAGATLAVAALFQPARRRIQAVVDRLNRRRYDAARTVDGFSARLRDEVDLDTLSAGACRSGPDDAANHGVRLATSNGPRQRLRRRTTRSQPTRLDPLHAMQFRPT